LGLSGRAREQRAIFYHRDSLYDAAIAEKMGILAICKLWLQAAVVGGRKPNQ
jgi:hypothetical protein